MRTNRKDILLALGWYHPKLHKGVLKFAMQENWRIHSRMAFHKNLPKNWQGDGILLNPFSLTDIDDFFNKLDQPVVGICDPCSGNQFPFIIDDKLAAAQLAIRHFCEKGFQNFAYVDLYAQGQNSRIKLFRDELKKIGIKAHKIAPNPANSFAEQQKYLMGKIVSLPKPLAVLAADDNTAVEFSYAVTDAKVSIPEELAILGIHNDQLICQNSPITISSIDINFEKIGFQAAKTLQKIINGESVETGPILVAPKGVIERASTDILVHDHPTVMNALHYINLHYRAQITVSAIARHCNITTRGLHKAFTKQLGRSITEELLRLRLIEAKRLLKEDKEQKIVTIAHNAGFGTLANMYKAFKKHLKITPNQYRHS